MSESTDLQTTEQSVAKKRNPVAGFFLSNPWPHALLAATFNFLLLHFVGEAMLWYSIATTALIAGVAGIVLFAGKRAVRLTEAIPVSISVVAVGLLLGGMVDLQPIFEYASVGLSAWACIALVWSAFKRS